MRVIGTAGHVDHGKSSLVRRLTGIDPDRLEEEKRRAMTIDLGFAWMRLDDEGDMIGIVDVPGHRDFIENMLAGVSGIDAVILVIAADEGVMPQTREHLAIMDLLGVQRGLVALTKTDMVDDPDWLELVQLDVHEVLASTSLHDAPIIPLSSHTGAGIDQLKAALRDLLASMDNTRINRQPRLPVDRVFTISGFGTVVTGTLQGGSLRIGDELEIQPGGLRARVRGLQSYQQKVETAETGSRVAVNLSGIEKSDVRRGDVVSTPGTLHPTLLIDVRYRHLKDASRPLAHNTQVKLFSNAAELTGKVRLLDSEAVLPGQEAWLQIRLDSALPALRGDRFVLRLPSPAETIGGGLIVNPAPGRRWKRFRPQVIHQLETLLEGTPADRMSHAATGKSPFTLAALAQKTGMSDDEARNAIEQALSEGQLVQLERDQYLATNSAYALLDEMRSIVSAFHRAEPLRLGMPREAMRSKLGIKNPLLSSLLNAQQDILTEGSLVRLSTHSVQYTEAQQHNIDQLMQAMNDAPYTPPSVAEATLIVGEDLLQSLIEHGLLIRVQPDVIFTPESYRTLVDGVGEIIRSEGSVDAKSLRDAFNTSRKYAIGLLEHLDSIGVTKRVGDMRVFGKNPR